MTRSLHGAPLATRVVAIVALVAACSGPIAPSGGQTPVPSGSGTASGTPGASGQPSDPVSPTPVPSPTTLADALATIPRTEGVLNTVWLGKDQIVVGGFSGPAFTPTILVFELGAWSVAAYPEASGQVAAIAELDGRLIAVGNTLPDTRTGYIWESDDGMVWRVAQTIDDAALYDIAANGDVAVAAGALLTDEMDATAAAWVSSDGTSWEPADVAGAAGAPMGTIAATPSGFAATGDRPLGEDRPFWTSDDATTWTPVPNDLSDQYLPADLEAWGDRLVLVGASGRSGDQHPFVAVSNDGRAWDGQLLSEAEGYASAVTIVRETVFAAGVDADVLTLFSPLGADVVGIPIEPMGASIGALRWDPDWGLVGVGTKDSAHMVWLLPTG